MKKFALALAVAGLAAVAVGQESDGGGWSGNGWRLSVGPAVEIGMKSRLTLDASRAVAQMPAAARSGGTSRTVAQRQGDAIALNGRRLDFCNGGFIDPNDDSGTPGETWNWRIPAGALDSGGRMSFSSPYSTRRVDEVWNTVSDKDEWTTGGVSIALDRNVLTRGMVGLDAGMGLSLFTKDGFAKFGGTAWTRTETTSRGEYVTDVSFNQDVVGDEWARNPDGSYGAGTRDGPGPVLDLDSGDVRIAHRWANQHSSRKTTALALHGEGDWREIEAAFAVKPYVQSAGWVRVHAILGVAVAFSRIEFDIHGSADDFSYSTEESFDKWGVYGIGGGGISFLFGRWSIGCDAVARLFDKDIDLHGKDVYGTIERAPVVVQMFAGMDF